MIDNNVVYEIPEWEGSAFQKFAKNFCYKNQWRVKYAVGDYDDCLQECYLQYLYVKKYMKTSAGPVVNTPQHFMTLYKLAVVQIFNTYSVRDTGLKNLQNELPAKEQSIESEANLAVKLSEASSELKSVLGILMSAPKEIMDVLRQDTSSLHPKKFFLRAVKAAGVNDSHAPKLIRELQKLLT